MGLESEYANCLTLTVIPPATYTTAESDVPVIVRIGRSAGKYRDDTSDVFSKLGASYQKMAVSLDDGVTECPVEVKDWDVDRQLGILFVKIPSVPTTGMTLKLWYDSTHADNTTNVGTIGSAVGQSVWANGFAGVWHMKNSGGLVLDSTANGNHGTIYGATEVDGPLGRCLSFDGAGDYVGLPPLSDHFSESATLSVRLKLAKNIPETDLKTGCWHLTGAASIGSEVFPYSHYPYTDGTIYMATFRNDRISFYPCIRDKTMPHAVTISTSPGMEGWKFYHDDQRIYATDGLDRVYLDDPSLCIGQSTGDYYLDGEIYIVTLSSVARSPAWIALQNASLKDELIAFSEPGSESLSGTERMRLTPDGTLIANEFVEV